MVHISAVVFDGEGAGVEAPLLLYEVLKLIIPHSQIHRVAPPALRVPFHVHWCPGVEGAADFDILGGSIGPGERDGSPVGEVLSGGGQVAVLHET